MLAKGSARRENVRTADKLKSKKREGSPDKLSSPNLSQSADDDSMYSTKIDGTDVQALAIDTNELQRMRKPRPPSSKKSTNIVTVRKFKPKLENEIKKKHVIVAKPVPANVTTQEIDYTKMSGLKYDLSGQPIPYSILGSVGQYLTQCDQHGDTQFTNITPTQPETQGRVGSQHLTPPSSSTPDVKNVYPPFRTMFDEHRALNNWQRKMLERKRQQGYISKLLEKPVEQLAMNQGENYRAIEEDRYIIDRTIAAVDYGKGYRLGSEFWQQSERIGDDLTGINFTLTQTGRGYPPPIEHVGYPTAVKFERGTNFSHPLQVTKRDWYQSEYLRERTEQLHDIINELDPHLPDFKDLVVIGRNKPHTPTTLTNEVVEEYLTDDMKVSDRSGELSPALSPYDESVNIRAGPCLQIGEQQAYWTGDSTSLREERGPEVRLMFEVYSGRKCVSYLDLSNIGTTVIHTQWKKLPKTNPYENPVDAKIQRFYFDTSEGCLLPGQTLSFPFMFKSLNSGIFSESWVLDTQPILCGGAAIVVTLRGVALQEDTHLQQRLDLERELNRKQAETAVSHILYDLLEGVRSPVPPPSPIDIYITDEELFGRLNPGLTYNNEIIAEVHKLHSDLIPEEERENQPWDLSFDNLRSKIGELDDESLKEKLMKKMNTLAYRLMCEPLEPSGKQELYNVCYQNLVSVVDSLVGNSMMLRSVMGLPELDLQLSPDGQIPDKPLGTLRKMKEKEEARKKQKAAEAAEKKDKKGDKKGGGKERPRSKGAASKQGKAPKTPTPGATTRDSSVLDTQTERPSSQVSPGAELTDQQQSITAITTTDSTTDINDIAYKNKLNNLVYESFVEMFDSLSHVFTDIQRRNPVNLKPSP